MCGIAGVVGGLPAQRRSLVERMQAALCHRGPDGRGLVSHPQVDLAHTRLAIIDPTSRSDQPMVHPATGCVLVFNGEIYNYRELRPELEARGHRFRSAGDTEVLLLSYVEWGEECLRRLNGMFAFAIWDPRREQVLLARDRLGEKPLHLAHHDGALWFASEIKALVASGVAGTRADSAQLFRFLARGDLGHPTATPFAGVDQLPAAHLAWVDPSGAMQRRAYWDLPSVADRTYVAAGEVAEEFRRLFDDSVRIRLRSDVPLGTSLSGGLDSSAVLATVRRHRPDGELHAFTASFPGSPMDELGRAEEVAKRLDVVVHPVPLGAADLDADLDAMIWANEGPVESASALAQYRVMREAREAGVTVLLDGQGADETWAGYEKYAGEAVVDLLARGRVRPALALAAQWRAVRGSALVPPLGRYVGLALGPTGRRAASSLLAATESWLAPEFRRHHATEDPLVDGRVRAVRPGSVAPANALLDLHRVTLPRLLRYADRNSMAWSREVRLPFLDHRLVELAAATPLEAKIVEGWTKEPVRRLLEAAGLPEVARRRDKVAYMPPAGEWLAHPPVAARVADAWTELHRAGLLSGAVPSGGPTRRWRVLAVATWARRFGVTWP